jgi:two-component system KDP operon response regulator KdpE
MNGSSPKVLVVDDEAPIRKLLRTGLSSKGYEILEAANGKSALDLLSSNIALVILDLGLPDIHGLELLQIIRSRREGY